MASLTTRRSAAALLELLAERNPRRAGQLALQALEQQPHDGAALLAIGWALLRWERLGPAVAALERAAPRLGPGAPALRCARALLMARQIGGAGPEHQQRWEAHAEACAAAGALAELARARCEQIAHLNLLGHHLAARALAAQSHELVAQHGAPADLARLQHVWGVAAFGCGDLATGRAQLDAAAAAFARLRRPADLARAQFERAWLWVRHERLAEAEADLRRALATYGRLELPLRVALCTRDLGSIARLKGEYGEAIALLVAARDQFTAIGRDDMAAGCDFNLATVAHMTGLHDLALAAYRRSQAIYEEAGDEVHAVVASRNQGLALTAYGRPAEALALIDALTPRALALGDRLEQAELQAARAQALRGLGRLDEAAAELEAAHRRFLALGNDPAAAECLLDLAWLRIEQVEPAEAAAYLRVAQAELRQRPAHGWRVAYGLGRVAEQQGDQAGALRHYMRAAKTVARLRRPLASEHASSRLYALGRQLHHDALRLAAAAGDPERLLAIAEHQRGLVLTRHLRATHIGAEGAQPAQSRHASDELRSGLQGQPGAPPLAEAINGYVTALLQDRHRSLAAIDPAEPLSPGQVRKGLTRAFGHDWSLLYPILADDALLLVGVTPQGATLERQPFDGELKRLIERTCRPSQRAATFRSLEAQGGDRRPAWADLRALAERLLPRWLQERLTPQHRLLVVPSGPLHMLPWAALRLPHGWLCELAVVELLTNLAPPAATGALADAPALLIGCDSFGERAPPLPAAMQSLELAGRWQRGEVRRIAGAEATCAALTALSASGALQRYRLIHLASHARLGGADGLLAHIKLADRDLLLDEVLRLRLARPLVVLAACEGGAGNVLPGDEVLGLSRALIAAGAASVVANLWPIYDRGTLALLGPLYRALGEGADAALALALAQRSLIAGPHPDDEVGALMYQPFVWAGFTVTTGP